MLFGDSSVPASMMAAALSGTNSIQLDHMDMSTDSDSLLHSHSHSPPSHRISLGGLTPGGSLLVDLPRNDRQWRIFEQGMRFGCMLSLLAWVMWDCIVDARLRPADQDLWIQLVLPVYRGLGCLVLLFWCWGCSLYVWERFRINYPFLLDLDTRSGATMMSYAVVFDECTNITCVYLANFLLYFKIMRGDFPSWVSSGYLPVIFVVYLVLKICPLTYWLGWNTSPSANRNSALWSGFAQVPMAPFGKVTFMTGLLGDAWTSMVRVTVDLAYTVCFIMGMEWMVEMDVLAQQREAAVVALVQSRVISSGQSVAQAMADASKVDTCLTSTFFKRALIPLLSALPLWFRFMQCIRRYLTTRKRWPHIGNACKYAVAHSIVLFGVFNSAALAEAALAESPYKQAWLGCMVLSTLYTYWWDVYMDWGLGRWAHGLLREELMYPNRAVYYAAMAIDLFMRFAWTLTLIPQGADSPMPKDFMLYLQPMLAAGEILRRSMWGCFRLEWEHICTQSSHHSGSMSVASPPSPEMSGTKVILEVAVLVTMVLSLGAVAALSSH